MRSKTVARFLWGEQSHLAYLLLAASFLLFISLDAREIWTQEHRWVDVVSGMFYSHDFLHPMLNGNEYYDKPLLSYWLIALLVQLTGKLSLWAMRLPSALAGMLAVGSIYYIGLKIRDRALGLLAGWLLLTCFYFIFWARVSSTDMLNCAGTLFAIAWFFAKSSRPSFWNYTIFFLIIAVTALCKGLVAPAVVCIAVVPAIALQGKVKFHICNPRLYLACLPASVLYGLPFWMSEHWRVAHYHSNGLIIMIRENFVRYFQPFDHQDPFYLYFIYLPVYLLPWTLLFFAALVSYRLQWRTLSFAVKWLMLTILLLLLFFMCCGSRRAYYILPILPFALLLTADWTLTVSQIKPLIERWVGRGIVFFYILFAVNYAMIQPIYYSKGGVITFFQVLNAEVSQIKPWSTWNFSLLDAQTKVNFYLHLPPNIINYGIVGSREAQTVETLQQTWPTFKKIPANTIFITRRLYGPILGPVLKNYRLVEAAPTYLERFLHRPDPDAPVAYVPLH